jgi:fatty acid desaturase
MAAPGQRANPLFRDRRAARLNSAVLLLTTAAWVGAFPLMASGWLIANVAGVLLGAQAMVLAAYLVHEAAHNTLFARTGANVAAGEVMSFIAGSPYASFARIRHMHIRHHVDRADLACFDFKVMFARSRSLCRLVKVLEWAYIPAVELLMHGQVMVRPFLVESLNPHRWRVLWMIGLRGALLTLLALVSVKALLLFFLACFLQLHVLNFFDAFHHTFEQYFVAPDEPLTATLPSREYELSNTYSNLVSTRLLPLNLLILNFGYHNAHHYRASAPWYRLPALHRSLYGESQKVLLPLSQLLGSWHKNRVRRVDAADYGSPADASADFVGAHGVSFLTVV